MTHPTLRTLLSGGGAVAALLIGALAAPDGAAATSLRPSLHGSATHTPYLQNPVLQMPTQQITQPGPAATTARPAAATGGEATDETPGETDERPIITADELIHDRALDTVTARGDVEILYQGAILRADTVSYQVTADRATASGNVVLVSPDGVTTFADFADLSGDFAEGYAREVRILLLDGSRAAGREAFRSGGTRTELTRGVYSACDACPDGSGRPLVWQVRAMRVVRDEAAESVTYNHAWLEVFGVPVLYTPWLRHPDPTIRRRSGFLPPSIGGSEALGDSITVTTPYFWAIDDHHDLTLSPTFAQASSRTGNARPLQGLLAAEHRWRGERATLDSVGSITNDNANRTRWHVDSAFQHHFNETWRAGAEVQLTSDDTYRRIYGYGTDRYLTNTTYVEGFSQRSYATVRTLSFRDQSIRGRDLPLAAPLAEWSLVSAPGERGQVHSARITTAVLTRTGSSNTDSRRVSAEYGWHLPYVSRIGEIWRLDVNVRGDAYDVTHVARPGQSTFNGQVGRFYPVTALTWSWPFEQRRAGYQQVFEPIVQGVIAPRGQNPASIPNEDSRDFEFDDSNLFALNRFTGYDRVEGGARINYGLRWGIQAGPGGSVNAFIGQSYRPTTETMFGPQSGLRGRLSDYVGRVDVRPAANLGLTYRFRVDRKTLEARRNEASAWFGPAPFRVSASYTSAASQRLEGQTIPEVRELSGTATSAFSRYWSISGGATYSLATADRGFRRAHGALSYDDECTAMSFTVTRNFAYDRDFRGGLTFLFTVSLKTLGDIRQSL